MVDEITRHSRFTAEAFHALEAADSFIGQLPSDAVEAILLDGDTPVQPDVKAREQYRRNPGAPHGIWPSSSEISRAMLERYGAAEP